MTGSESIVSHRDSVNSKGFDHMDAEKKDAMMRNTAESLPLRRVGQPQDMGEAIYHLLESHFVTGVDLDCDGGHHIRHMQTRIMIYAKR